MLKGEEKRSRLLAVEKVTNVFAFCEGAMEPRAPGLMCLASVLPCHLCYRQQGLQTGIQIAQSAVCGSGGVPRADRVPGCKGRRCLSAGHGAEPSAGSALGFLVALVLQSRFCRAEPGVMLAVGAKGHVLTSFRREENRLGSTVRLVCRRGNQSCRIQLITWLHATLALSGDASGAEIRRGERSRGGCCRAAWARLPARPARSCLCPGLGAPAELSPFCSLETLLRG